MKEGKLPSRSLARQGGFLATPRPYRVAKNTEVLSEQTHFQQTVCLTSPWGVAVQKRGRGLAGKNPFNQAQHWKFML